MVVKPVEIDSMKLDLSDKCTHYMSQHSTLSAQLDELASFLSVGVNAQAHCLLLYYLF